MAAGLRSALFVSFQDFNDFPISQKNYGINKFRMCGTEQKFSLPCDFLVIQWAIGKVENKVIGLR